ncbi:MAG TPA: glycoside hydrolase family 57 protein [Candidatus Acidoferrum sp.]|jgi:alpha-amylase/alpha-mannosidase (GH57 family)|nr:glycoside hydrolase family 57 protein [Candidatus Acidoferrum sp.]
MNRVHLVLLWHMHQPQYRDPETGRYVLAWTRLHALKDYWGMAAMLKEFPKFHATFNVVPSLGMQLEEYASGEFNEPWFSLAFKSAEELTREDKTEILARAFQVNHERLMSRWPRFVELYEWSRPAGGAQAQVSFTLRDWRDLQLLSQLVWMEETWFEKDSVVSRLASKGKEFTEKDKTALKAKQLELLGLVLPEYRAVAQTGQIELSTTPFYHPILPLICDSDIARVANPGTPLPRRAYRHPEDAREQLRRAREYHERVFGEKPAGLWPSEGSVSDQALTIAAEEGFQWFGTDEGVLGRTLNAGFFRDAKGVPANADRLYKPLRVQLAGNPITGLFRDHHLSDLIGFVYSRMNGKDAAADLHGRLRELGERVQTSQPLTVCLFLDGENAWEYYPGNGREFLREFYGRIQGDQDFRALTATEAIASAGVIPTNAGIFPASWINANFDVWIGHSEDVAAWELLWDAREAYGRAVDAGKQGRDGAPTETALKEAQESLLAAEGSDWCWWYGPEHSTANDAEFDALYRKHLTAVYLALGQVAPQELAKPIKRQPEHALQLAPTGFLKIAVDGRDTSYFEWLGAGLYSPERRGGAMHGRTFYLHELRYGFEEERFCVRVDPFLDLLGELEDCEFRITIGAAEEINIVVKLIRGHLQEFAVEKGRLCLLNPKSVAEAAFDRILEVSIHRSEISLQGQTKLKLGVALWHGGLPVDVLPAEGFLEVQLGEDHSAWPTEDNS